MANSANSIPIPGGPNPAQAQIIYMSILTAARDGDFNTAQSIVQEFESQYGLIPLLICGVSFANSIVDAYAESLEQTPQQIMQKLAIDSLLKKENPS